MAARADAAADRFSLENVRAVGEMQVVGFGGAQRQHGDLHRMLAQVSVIEFREHPGTHAYLDADSRRWDADSRHWRTSRQCHPTPDNPRQTQQQSAV